MDRECIYTCLQITRRGVEQGRMRGVLVLYADYIMAVLSPRINHTAAHSETIQGDKGTLGIVDARKNPTPRCLALYCYGLYFTAALLTAQGGHTAVLLTAQGGHTERRRPHV